MLRVFKCFCADFLMGGNGSDLLFGDFSLDCIFSNSTSIPRSMKKMAFSTMLPFMLLSILMLFWALHAVKRSRGSSYIFRHWIVTGYVVFYISYTSMTETLLKLAICQSADNATNDEHTRSIAHILVLDGRHRHYMLLKWSPHLLACWRESH